MKYEDFLAHLEDWERRAAGIEAGIKAELPFLDTRATALDNLYEEARITFLSVESLSESDASLLKGRVSALNRMAGPVHNAVGHLSKI